MTQLIDSQRIKKIIDHLINIKVIKNEAEFCKRLGYASGNLAKIKNGKRNISASLILKMESEFGFNREYLSNDTNPIVVKRSQLFDKKEGANRPENTKEEKSYVPYKKDLADLIQYLYDDLQRTKGENTDSKDRHIATLEKNNNAILLANKQLSDSAKDHAKASATMSRIVDLCLNAGAITIDPTKKVDLSKM